MRACEINRTTNETDITLTLNLDGSGKFEITTDCGFLAHMLTLFARHGGFDLTLHCKGDSEVDFHHTAEDIGICLGRAIREAAGDCRGIRRYGDIILPMDESLILCAVDFGGRAYLGFDVLLFADRVGDFDCELLEEFLTAFVREAQMNLHVQKLRGTNSHHIIEGCFKAVARALRWALSADPTALNTLPSTKGVL